MTFVTNQPFLESLGILHITCMRTRKNQCSHIASEEAALWHLSPAPLSVPSLPLLFSPLAWLAVNQRDNTHHVTSLYTCTHIHTQEPLRAMV